MIDGLKTLFYVCGDRCSYPIIAEILRYEIFRKKREKCSALQKIPKIGRNLQRNAFFIG